MESAMKKSKALQTEKSKKTKVAEAYNKAFMAEIQPKGGLVFEDKYVKKADGYETCLHVYDMKTTQNTFWLNLSHECLVIRFSHFRFFTFFCLKGF